MASEHTPADDVVYDLVSVQYHALKAAQTYDKYQQDAHDHAEIREFFAQCAEEDARRAQRCHELLAQVTGSSQS
ncbi:hypothetical protein [Motilibacter aurantiacus]|uniref:hypothetical protein n=1 Tax=Motilibacter aurantiacus TaxID=2714955 RepID=UPI00140C7C39|nr:hypothetical protein [Motilibacter aurantiacus]NHC44433.1 hypothetical protein [Motilibacter aurantiacus]